MTEKRKRDDDGDALAAHKVALHYSGRDNQTTAQRQQSPIYHLRCLNNWVRAFTFNVHNVIPFASSPLPETAPVPPPPHPRRLPPSIDSSRLAGQEHGHQQLREGEGSRARLRVRQGWGLDQVQKSGRGDLRRGGHRARVGEARRGGEVQRGGLPLPGAVHRGGLLHRGPHPGASRARARRHQLPVRRALQVGERCERWGVPPPSVGRSRRVTATPKVLRRRPSPRRDGRRGASTASAFRLEGAVSWLAFDS